MLVVVMMVRLFLMVRLTTSRTISRLLLSRHHSCKPREQLFDNWWWFLFFLSFFGTATLGAISAFSGVWCRLILVTLSNGAFRVGCVLVLNVIIQVFVIIHRLDCNWQRHFVIGRVTIDSCYCFLSPRRVLHYLLFLKYINFNYYECTFNCGMNKQTK